MEARRARRITVEEARRRVRRGAAYLDEVAPGWSDHLNLFRLDLAHGDACVLGQLHGSYSIGLGRSGIFSVSSAPRASFSPVDLGFHCVQGVCEALQEQDYEYLNQAWHEEVEKRTAATRRTRRAAPIAGSLRVVSPESEASDASAPMEGDGHAGVAAPDISASV